MKNGVRMTMLIGWLRSQPSFLAEDKAARNGREAEKRAHRKQLNLLARNRKDRKILGRL
jgi:hypothetical protein